MFLNIRSFLIGIGFMICSAVMCAQDTTSAASYSYKRKGLVNTQLYIPNAIGSNFVSDGMKVKPGFKLSALGRIYPKVLLGVRYSLFEAEVIQPEYTGSYERSRVFLIGGDIGYQFDLLSNLDLIITAGGGYVSYLGIKDDLDFRDSGGAIWLNPEWSYSIFKWLAIMAGVEIRADYLNIKTAPQLEGNFNQVTYLNLGSGLRFML